MVRVRSAEVLIAVLKRSECALVGLPGFRRVPLPIVVSFLAGSPRGKITRFIYARHPCSRRSQCIGINRRAAGHNTQELNRDAETKEEWQGGLAR